MGGTYMAIVYGFGGLRLKETGLYFAPHLPKPWNAYRFKVRYQGSQILVEVKNSGLVFTLISGSEKTIRVYGKVCQLRDILEAPLGC
jgi:alpha,alpha-trehalose phosphorylase